MSQIVRPALALAWRLGRSGAVSKGRESRVRSEGSLDCHRDLEAVEQCGKNMVCGARLSELGCQLCLLLAVGY